VSDGTIDVSSVLARHENTNGRLAASRLIPAKATMTGADDAVADRDSSAEKSVVKSATSATVATTTSTPLPNPDRATPRRSKTSVAITRTTSAATYPMTPETTMARPAVT